MINYENIKIIYNIKHFYFMPVFATSKNNLNKESENNIT